MSIGFSLTVNGEKIHIESRCSWHPLGNGCEVPACDRPATHKMVNYRGWSHHQLCPHHKYEAMQFYWAKVPSEKMRLEEITQ